jgi:hypothetical protein
MNSIAVDNYTKVNLGGYLGGTRSDLNLNALFFYYNTALDLNYLHKSNLEHYSFLGKAFADNDNTGFLYIKLMDFTNFIPMITPPFSIKNDYYTPVNNYIILNSGTVRFSTAVNFIRDFTLIDKKNIPYNLDFSEQTIFSTGFNSLFGSHVANSIVFDNNTMLVFHNIFKQEYI